MNKKRGVKTKVTRRRARLVKSSPRQISSEYLIVEAPSTPELAEKINALRIAGKTPFNADDNSGCDYEFIGGVCITSTSYCQALLKYCWRVEPARPTL